MLSLHKLFLPCEIHYGCRFCNGVMVMNLRYRGETESLLWMCTQDYAAWRMPVPKSLVMIHCGTTLICYLLWTSSLKQFLCCLLSYQARSIIFAESKGHTTFVCGLFSLILIVITYTSSLDILYVKVKPWSFLVLEDSWLALKWRLIFPIAEMQEFVQLFSYLIHVFPNQVDDSSGMKKQMNNLTKWISTQVHNLL
jgi:hypothetical protein